MDHQAKEAMDVKSPKSKQCWSAFQMSGLSSTLNLYPKGTLVYQSFYVQVLKGLLMPWVSRIRVVETSLMDCSPQHGAGTFFAPNVAVFSKKEEWISAMDHPPHSPDLALADFWLFHNWRVCRKESFSLTLRTLNHLWENCWQIFLLRSLKPFWTFTEALGIL
jgi:hypothetical protein